MNIKQRISEIIPDIKEKKQKVKRTFEISPKALEERRLLTAFLLDKKEELIHERNIRRDKIERDTIELRGGKSISRLQIRLLVTSLNQDYDAAFPNENPFFKHMFRLHPKLMGLDYNKYKKPRLAGRLLKRLTYDRFEIEVLPTLLVFAVIDGMWITKCYKHLTREGIETLIRFRDEANEMMKDFKDGQWYEFYAQFEKIYRKQLRLF